MPTLHMRNQAYALPTQASNKDVQSKMINYENISFVAQALISAADDQNFCGGALASGKPQPGLSYTALLVRRQD